MWQQWNFGSPHLNPLPEGEEDAKRQVRVTGLYAAFSYLGILPSSFRDADVTAKYKQSNRRDRSRESED
jgi:hypothetical protein